MLYPTELRGHRHLQASSLDPLQIRYKSKIAPSGRLSLGENLAQGALAVKVGRFRGTTKKGAHHKVRP